MSAKALADLFITLRSLYTILLVFSLTGALLPLKGKKLKPLSLDLRCRLAIFDGHHHPSLPFLQR
jgi:hypothetical protein